MKLSGMHSLFSLTGPGNVVICSGVARSGTTLLLQVLSTAAGANPPGPEFTRLQQVMRVAEVAKSMNLDMKYLRRKHLRQELQRQLRIFWRKQGKPKLLVGKDPLLTNSIVKFVKLMPDVKNVISLRDPRDTVCSMLTVRGKMLADPQCQRNFITNMDERAIVEYVMYRSRMILAISNRPNVYVARYERLVALDPAFRRELSNFVGQEISFETPDVTHRFDPKSHFHTEVLGQKPTTSRIGRHAKLPDHLLGEFERHQDLLIELGYAPGKGHPGLGKDTLEQERPRT
jgi:hypothetical protein